MLNEIVESDCIEFMQWIPDNSIDSCVTDPPYGLSFMGKEWDTLPEGKEMQDWFYKWGKELFRIMKHGAHILVFSGARTYHRMACAMEDAGFEVRDMVEWIYGSGFPKGLNVGKKLDGWDGWNTQLKPAHEPILLARKPIAEKTIIDNVSRYGTGAINIDATRIAVNPEIDDMLRKTKRDVREAKAWKEGSGFKNEKLDYSGVLPSGRYPANLILSHHPDCELIQEGKTIAWSRERNEGQSTGVYGIYGDRERAPIEVEYDEKTHPEIWKCVEGCAVKEVNLQSGTSNSRGGRSYQRSSEIYGDYDWKDKVEKGCGFGDVGGAARFFYCAKASKKEKDAGLEERNPHITVKPLKLMRYLVRMITPKGGVVIDPFVGSGTTAIAAMLEGFDFLACDKDKRNVEIAKKRLEHWIQA